MRTIERVASLVRLKLLFVAVLIALSGCVSTTPDAGTLPSPTANESLPDGPSYEVTVTDVVDGDTVDIRFANGTTDTIRLLGIDTPETRAETDPTQYEGMADTAATRSCLQSAGENASHVLETRLSGETITLQMDPQSDSRGGYGRILGYISHDGTNVNLALVSAGHARVYDSTFSLRSTFDAAEGRARTDDRGLWRCG